MLEFLSWFGLGPSRRPKQIWICSDVWLDILPFFDHFELGLQLAPLSFRFDALVDKHFNVTKQLTIWRTVKIHKDSATEEVKFSVDFGKEFVPFPMPQFPLPQKIRFRYLQIWYIDHSVIKFLNENKQIFGKVTDFGLKVSDETHIWEIAVNEIWPIFVTSNIRRLCLRNPGLLNKLRRFISPTVLSDLPLLNSISAFGLLPDAIADDGPNATDGQALYKWLHTPTTDGRPKRLECFSVIESSAIEWITSFKEAFLRSTTSACYDFELRLYPTTSIEPFELVNERTNELLTMEEMDMDNFGQNLFFIKRCPIGETTQQEESEEAPNSDFFFVDLMLFDQSIGPLSPSFGSSVPIDHP